MDGKREKSFFIEIKISSVCSIPIESFPAITYNYSIMLMRIISHRLPVLATMFKQIILLNLFCPASAFCKRRENGTSTRKTAGS